MFGGNNQSRSVVLNWGPFCPPPPRRHLAMFRDIFVCYNLGGAGVGRDAAQHPEVLETMSPRAKSDLAQHVSSAQAEKR